MEIPKKIEILINKRQHLSEMLNSTDIELSNWMEKKGMDLAEHAAYTRTGCMIYCEPQMAAESVRQAIKNFNL